MQQCLLIRSNYGKDIINLYDALDWCLKNNIFLVNLSFGTTHFKDFSEIQKTVNYFTNKGMLLICATSNDNLTTYQLRCLLLSVLKPIIASLYLLPMIYTWELTLLHHLSIR